MSLLIDALKQAEAARARAEGGEQAPDGLSLEPLSTLVPTAAATAESITPPPTPAPATVATPRRTRPAPSAASQDPAAATRELFEVKRESSPRWPLIALLGFSLLALIAGGIYVWWAIQPRSSLLLPTAERSASPIDARPAPPPAASSATPLLSGTSASSASSSSPASTLPAPLPQISTTRTPPAPRAALPRRASDVTAPAAARPVDADTTGLRIQPGLTGNPPLIQSAYAALTAGDLPAARQRYQEVLAQDGRNLDALNGLGVIAWREGRADLAERHFRTALQIDPTESSAASQLALLYAEGNPAAAEARLRSLIATQPGSAAAHLALGNLLARQGRWQEAQQALFQAYTLDSLNPDALFNLAVSLEHLNQGPIAAQFYERALQAALRRPAGFDRNAALLRLQVLGTR